MQKPPRFKQTETLKDRLVRIATDARAEAARLSQWQRRTRRAKDFLREFLIVDETGKHHRPDHGRPGGNRRASFLLRHVAFRLNTEIIDPAANGLRHSVPEISGAPRGFCSQTRKQARGGPVVSVPNA